MLKALPWLEPSRLWRMLENTDSDTGGREWLEASDAQVTSSFMLARVSIESRSGTAGGCSSGMRYDGTATIGVHKKQWEEVWTASGKVTVGQVQYRDSERGTLILL